jgi:hypothetical protein
MIRILLALWGGLMGAATGACLLALAGAFLASEILGGFEGAAALAGGWLGAFAGALLGLALGLWLVLRKDGRRAGIAAAGLTGAAVLMVAGFVLAAFD